MPQTDIMKKNMPLKEWLPLLGMTFSAFVVNTSEFMPIGLLTNIAADFGITEAHAGLLISVYAWVVMLLSLPLMLLVCRMEMRKLLLCTLALFGVCQILSTVSGSFGALMASRIGVACSHAVFWSIASPIAVRVVSEEHRPLALSMIVTGSSVAMIFGLPLGRAIGLHIGWRMTFLCVGVLAFAIFAYLLKVAPRLPSRQTFTLRELPRLLRNPLLLGIYWLAALVATAYYTAYSYIEPFLKQVAQLPESWITLTLALFGVSGILGSFLFSWLYSRFPHTFIKLSLGGIAGALLLLYPASFQAGAVILLCCFWGVAATAFNIVCQAEIIKHTQQEATAVAMSIFSGIFNLGIGCGTLLGGAVCTYSSISRIGFAGGLVAVGAFFYCTRRLLKRLNP